jgi:hypothetical protein
MNNKLWVAIIAATLAPLVQAGSLHSKKPSLDEAQIQREAAAMVEQLNAGSPSASKTEWLGKLCDTVEMLSEKDPTSPRLIATKKAIAEQFLPSPLSLTRSLTRKISSPRLKPTPTH